MAEPNKTPAPAVSQGVRKKSLGKRTNVFLQNTGGVIGNYILKDVLIPTAKKAISDIVTNGINILLYGDQKPVTSKRGTIDRVSYRKYYEDERPRETRSRHKSFLEYDIEFDTQIAAQQTLEDMRDTLDRYPVVTVADLCEFAQNHDETIRLDSSWSDNKYGWVKLPAEIKIYPSYSKWIIDLPAPMPLD